jgi:2-phosphosulfolactate phosphatase
MKIRVVPEARSLDPDAVRGQIVVIIDTLRATTTIAAAVAAGTSVEPVKSVTAARRLRSSRALIAGERGGHKLPGFDFGNSPVEVGRASWTGKRLVLTTTNGTLAVARAKSAREIYAGALVNAGAIAAAVKDASRDLWLVCAGRTTGVALEDLAGAGAVLDRLLPDPFDPSVVTDGVRVSVELFRRERGRLHEFLLETESGRNLVKIGGADDLKACATLDTVAIAPRLVRGRFVA